MSSLARSRLFGIGCYVCGFLVAHPYPITIGIGAAGMVALGWYLPEFTRGFK